MSTVKKDKQQQIEFDSDNLDKFQDSFRRNHSQDMETPVGESMTIPDQSLTIQELMTRYARGLPLEGRDGYYEFDEDGDPDEGFPELEKMDLAEIQELKERNAAEVSRLQGELEKLEEGKKLLEKQRYEKALKDAIGKQLLERQEKELEDEAMKKELFEKGGQAE